MASDAPSDHRRKWDRSLYEAKAKERINEEIESLRSTKKEREAPVKRDLLQPREYTVHLESNLNKTQVISKTGPGSAQAGYYCNVCDCVVKDSINYLDHINGKKHQRNLGMSMRVQRSTLNDVKSRFAVLKKKNDEKKKEYSFIERVKEIAEEEEKLKAYRKERRKERKRKDNSNDDEVEDEEMKKLMGFGGFHSSKRPR